MWQAPEPPSTCTSAWTVCPGSHLAPARPSCSSGLLWMGPQEHLGPSRQYLGKEPARVPPPPALSERPASVPALLRPEAQKSVLRRRACSAPPCRASQAGPAAPAGDSPRLLLSCLFPPLPARIPRTLSGCLRPTSHPPGLREHETMYCHPG